MSIEFKIGDRVRRKSHSTVDSVTHHDGFIGTVVVILPTYTSQPLGVKYDSTFLGGHSLNARLLSCTSGWFESARDLDLIALGDGFKCREGTKLFI